MLFRDSAPVAAALLKRDEWQADEPDASLEAWVRSYVGDRVRRARYVAAASTHLHAKRIDTERVHDVVLVGGGLHAAAFLYALRGSNPALDVLIAERSEEICSTFARLGDSLVLNSPTFSRVGLNANLVPGHFVQVSDFDEVAQRPFPTAKHLHQLATMVMFHADADIEFGFEVEDVRRSGATYVLSSRDRTLRAKSVVICNGMGAPTTDAYEHDARSERVVFGDAFIAACFSDADHLESLRGKTVAVVGAGDTANCVMEYLVPLSYPNGEYGFSSASAILPASILWIGQQARDVREYFFANKRRYCHAGGVIELCWRGEEPLELAEEVWTGAKRTLRCVPERLVSLAHRRGQGRTRDRI
ncbi:MAG: hypothetical protein AAGA54_14025 [Myxococcota bacterium]